MADDDGDNTRVGANSPLYPLVIGGLILQKIHYQCELIGVRDKSTGHDKSDRWGVVGLSE